MYLKNPWLYLLILGVQSTARADPFSGSVTVLGSAVLSLGIASYNVILCRLYECCDKQWIINNTTALYTALDKRLHGQHLAKQAIARYVQSHVKAKDRIKSLVFSFHGPTGTGKTYVSSIIAEALYKKGLRSENVLMISVTKEFPHEEMSPLYMDRLSDMLEKQVRKCPQSMFIFDEIDKMPRHLLNTLKPYLDFHERLGGVDYRYCIFIFLSNVGADSITKYVHDQLKEGRKREDIKHNEIEDIIVSAVMNTHPAGGLWHSDLVSQHLITTFIPFLPLQRTHVSQCIRDVLVERDHFKSYRDIPKDVVDEVMQQIAFYPEREKLFSVTGCKRVAEKADYILLG
ncbi:hypothetical protein ACOMHN_011301 [Nucella lapillus]